MPAKLTIPTRVQGQDDAQYTQAVRESIKSQRPYLSDDEVLSLSSGYIQPVAVKATPQETQSNIAKFYTDRIKKTSEEKPITISKEQAAKIKSPFNENYVGQENYDKKKAFLYANELPPTLQDPQEAANKVKPTLNIKAEDVNAFKPEMGFPSADTRTPQQVQKTQEAAKELFKNTEGPAPVDFGFKKDDYILAAQQAMPNANMEQKIAYANVLKTNEDKARKYEAIQLSKDIADEDFNKSIQLDQILKQDRGTILEQKYGGFKDEINKSIREYIQTPQFKPDAVRIAKEKGVSLNQAAQIAIDEKSYQYANAPSSLEKNMQAFSDWAATNNIPLDYIATKTLGAGIKGLTDVGAFGAAMFEATVNGIQNKIEGNDFNFGNEFARRNAAMQRQSRVFIPQVQSEKATPFTQGVSDVTSMVAAIGAPMSVVPKINLFSKAKNILSLGRGGEQALQQGLSAEAQLAAKATTNANKLALDIGKILQSKPANVTANILDNTIQNYIVMGSPTMDAQRQKYLALGFREEKANRRASGMTFLTNLALALPGTLRPNEMSVMDKVFNLGTFKEGAKAAVKQGVHLGLDMTGLRTIEEIADERAMRQNGIEVEKKPLQQELTDKFGHAAKDFFGGVLMSTMGRMKYKQSDMQLAGLAEAFSNPEGLSESIKQSVRLGKTSKEDAVAFQSFLNTLKPEYDKAINETTKEGTPKFTPAIAAKVAIERIKQKQAEQALQSLENSVESWKTYENKDGKQVEKTLYRHSDGKMYDYEDINTKRQRGNLVSAVLDARKSVAQLESGQYVRGKLVSANQMKAIVEMNSLNGEAKKGQLEAVENGGAFENVEFEVVELAQQPKVKEKIKELEETGVTPELPIAGDIVVDEKGNVIDGTLRAAIAAMNGETKVSVMKPLSPEKGAEAVNIALGEKIGETAPNKKGLGETDVIAIDEVQDVYSKHLEENEGDFDGAMKAAAKDLIERQYTAEETKDMLERMNGGDALSDPLIDYVYREASKAENVPQETEGSGGVGGDVEFTAKGGNKVVDEKGEPITVYHGSNATFNEFKKTKSKRTILMSLSDVESDAFFFSNDKEFAKTFGKNVREYKINIKKPAQENQESLIKATKETYPDGSFETSNGLVYMSDYEGDSWVKRIADKDGIDWFLLDDNKFINNLKKEGIDGTGVWEDNGSTSYAVFDKSQIKALEQSKKETDGTTELERATRTSESKSEQGEGGASIAEQSDVRAVEANKEGQEAEQPTEIVAEEAMVEPAEKVVEETMPESEPKSEPKEEKTAKEFIEEHKGEMVERTLLSQRLKPSNIVDSVKQVFNAYENSMREIDSHEKADLNAARLIQEVGMDEAVRMAKSGEIQGAFQSAVLGAKWLEAENNRKAATTPEEIAAAEKEYSEILKYVGKTQEQMGGANSYWATFYSRNENLGLTTADKIARWEKISGQVASAEIREAYEKLDAKNKEQLAEIKKLKEQLESEALQEYIDEIKTRNKPKSEKPKETDEQRRQRISDRLFSIAEKVRKSETSGLTLSSPIPPHIISDSIKLLGHAAKGGEKIADAMLRVYELIENSIGKKLSDSDKSKVEKYFNDIVKESELPEVDTTEPLSTAVLKELVFKGYDTPELLFAKVKEFYPKGTSDRDIRDSITNYGKEILETQSEIGQKVSAIKSVWGKLSQLEDAQGGKLPFRRSAPENKQFRNERRRLTNELKEAMKNLDVPDVPMEDKWQTRIEASKKRYQNAIADYEKAIEDGEMIVRNKAEKLSNQDIEELKRELELIKDAYNDFFGEKPMSEGERKLKSLQTQLDSLYAEKEEAEKAEPQYTTSEIMDIEALQNEIAARKKALRLEGTEMQTAEDIRVEKLQKQLDAIGKERPTTKEVIDRSQREIALIKQIEAAKATLAETKKISEIDAKIAETEQKIQDQNFEAKKSESKEYSDAVQKKIDELNEVRNKLKEDKKAFEKSLKTDEQREIEKLERQFSSLKGKEPTEQIKKDKKQRSEKEIELLGEIASEKERLGLKKTELETKIIAKEKQVQKLRDKLEGAEADIPKKKQIVSEEINKLDAEANELRKLLREQKAAMPKEKLQLEAIDRAIDRVESLIKNNDLEIKRKPKEQKTLAVLAKKEVYDNVKKELLKAREEAGIVEKEQLRKRAEYLEKRNEYYKNRQKTGDYSKKERKKSPTSERINKLLGENDLLKFEEQKLMYQAEQQALSDWGKARNLIADIWNIPRIQMATGELSFIGVQGRRLSGSYLLKDPKVVKDAIKTMWKAMGSKEGLAEAMSKIKNDDPSLYHAMKASKLDLTETSFKVAATEENTQRIGGAFLWNIVMNNAIIPLAKGVDFITGKDVATIAKELKEKPPYEIFERGAVAYNNYLRAKAFTDFDALMKMDGKSFETNEKEYKLHSDFLNTATGRGKLPLGLESLAELLAKFLFSPRNFSSEFQLSTTPFGIAKLASMQAQSDIPLKNLTKEVSAVKEAAKHQVRYQILQTGLGLTLTGILYGLMGSTDDNEDGTGVELDHRSTKFGSITFEDGKTVDFFNGGLRYAILASRIGSQKYKTADKVKMYNDTPYYQKGQLKDLGEGYIPDGFDLFIQIAANKVNPSLGTAFKIIKAKPETELDKAIGVKRDRFGNRVDFETTFKELMMPIYFTSIKESIQNDPSALDVVGQLQAFLALASYRNQNKEKQAREEQEKVKKDLELYNKKRAMGLIK